MNLLRPYWSSFDLANLVMSSTWMTKRFYRLRKRKASRRAALYYSWPNNYPHVVSAVYCTVGFNEALQTQNLSTFIQKDAHVISQTL